MSNAESEDLVTVSRGGIVVEKSFEPNDFPVPAIAFVVRSERDEPVSLELNDTVPDHVPGEDIGFHPKYGAEFWEFDDGEIVFERDFEPHEEYTTVYGLRAADTDNPEQFMSKPEIESVDPPLDEDADDVIGEVVDSAGAGGAEPEVGEGGAEADGSDPVGVDIDIAEPDEGESAADDPEPAIERVPTEEEVADDDEPVEPIDLSDPGEESADLAVEESVEDDEDESTETEVDADAEADAQVAEDASTPDESSPTAVPSAAVDSDGAVEGAESGLAATLAAEIRNGEVDDDDLDVLQDALGAETVDNSVGARIEHLQSEIADLKAYSEALEEFIDENGDAQQVIEDIRADFEAATERLDDMEDRTSEAVEIAESVDDRLEESLDESEARVEELLEEGEERLDTLAEDAEARLDETVETAEAQVDETVETAEAQVDETVEEAESQVDETVEEAESQVDELVEEAESQVDETV
ncbi:hypothetical protein, partial [Natronomonas sp.]|uniref:hypothetical protein n=1 Tax=Natronomonas sp. TaxID=2184060 RepID=UPI002FC2F1C7